MWSEIVYKVKFYFLDIRLKVKMIEMPSRDMVKPLEEKLSQCRNQENNPDSEVLVLRL